MSDIRAQGKKPGAELPPERLPYHNSSLILSNVPLQPFVEGVLKGNLDFFIFFLPEGNERSGKQVIKEMARMFSCPVSQATLYQLLERLEKSEKLVKREGKGREKLYSLAPGEEPSGEAGEQQPGEEPGPGEQPGEQPGEEPEEQPPAEPARKGIFQSALFTIAAATILATTGIGFIYRNRLTIGTRIDDLLDPLRRRRETRGKWK